MHIICFSEFLVKIANEVFQKYLLLCHHGKIAETQPLIPMPQWALIKVRIVVFDLFC